MGNETSKPKSGNASGTASPTGERRSIDGGTAKLPSMSKSETTDSRRSFSGGLSGLRSKIPTRLKSDSPRASISASDGEEQRKESLSVKSARSRSKSPLRRSHSSAIESDNDSTRPESAEDSRAATPASGTPAPGSPRLSALEKMDVPQPPPSPSQSASLGRGHESVTRAQQSGEVDAVSEVGPSGSLHPSSNQQPKASILKPPENHSRKINPEDPLSFFKAIGSIDRRDYSSSPGAMSIGKIKPADLDDMINRLLDAGYSAKATKAVCLKNAEIVAICQAVKDLFLSQPSLLELSQPVKIVGDIHGQYVDLLRTFEMCGFPPSSNYLFLGDYVDRGKKSLETILLLFCYKLKFPENFFLLRGNHESANVTRVYGFYDECKRRTNIKIWKTFIDSFNALPIAAIVAGKIFCVHGGLSPNLSDMNDIRNIKRPTDVPEYGLLNDLLWSDPADMENDWENNERGVSYCFGKRVITEFLAKNDFDLVCRAHMVVEDGYEFFQDRVLVTVFSAPNYCGEFDNWGAVMSVNEDLLCSFELLKPLDSSALKSHIKKANKNRQSMFNSPPATVSAQSF